MSAAAFTAGRTVSLIQLAGGLVEFRLDRQGDPVNKLDAETVAEIDAASAWLCSASGVRGVLLGSAKPGFLAGADIGIFVELFAQPEATIVEFIAGVRDALTRVADLPVPVVAAVNGFALGGGLELALAADYRVLAGDGQIGLPETGLGLLPGAGGTVRLPRLAGDATALDWIVAGRPHKSADALAAGVVDAVAEPAALRDVALDWLQRAAAGELDWRARREKSFAPWAPDVDVFAAARTQARKTAVHYPAALEAIDLLERAAPLSRDEALQLESQAFARLAKTPTAKALVGIFLSDQSLKKKSKGQAGQGNAVQRSGVLGAGIMGGGIAYASAVRGIPVALKDIRQEALDQGVDEARKLLAKQVATGRLSEDKSATILSSIEPQLEFSGFDTLDIVIEAVVENLKIKQAVLGEVETLVRDDCVLASNTSSLSIGAIAAPLQRPENVVGMHFFNPVPSMPLVEVVRGERTGDTAVARAVGYVLAMGKTPLVVKDCAGFLINRLLGSYLTAFLTLVRDGADFARVDKAMEAWGWPMGPAYLIDVVGIDTLDKVLHILGEAYPLVMGTAWPTAINELARAGRYGQKNGAGFYQYAADAKGRPQRSDDPSALELLAATQGARRDFGDDEIVERMMSAMLLEAGRCLDEGVIETAQELDAGMRLGAGFPPHRGGPLWQADQWGTAQVLASAGKYASLGGLYAPGVGLLALAASNGHYYDAAQDGGKS
ncbi:MAG: fatty acid oxidation complex subunit alpha FadB [Pseudoxanthomonas sp.]